MGRLLGGALLLQTKVEIVIDVCPVPSLPPTPPHSGPTWLSVWGSCQLGGDDISVVSDFISQLITANYNSDPKEVPPGGGGSLGGLSSAREKWRFTQTSFPSPLRLPLLRTQVRPG